MTKAEWLRCGDVSHLLARVGGKVGARKVRLALCACLRAPQVWGLLAAPASRRAVEVGEAFADGGAGREELGQARKRASAVARAGWGPMPPCTPAAYLANYVCLQDRNLLAYLRELEWSLRQLRPPAGLLRDIFGDPFRPAPFEARWRSADAVGLAHGIYADRAFGRMPILADALEEAGCDHPQTLAHCRGPGLHARGCWVVDRVLDRE
jgi:hypothetical protein